MKKQIEIIKAARAKIAQGWMRGWFAQRADGSRCESRDDLACRWCAVGAVYAVENNSVDAFSVIMELRRDLPVGHASVGDWNDKQGSAFDILQVFDKTIARLENSA